MNGKISETAASELIREINKILPTEIRDELALSLINEVINPALQRQFNEGRNYAFNEIRLKMQNMQQ